MGGRGRLCDHQILIGNLQGLLRTRDTFVGVTPWEQPSTGLW